MISTQKTCRNSSKGSEAIYYMFETFTSSNLEL